MKKLCLLAMALMVVLLTGCSGIESNVREYDGVTMLRPDEGYVIFGTLSSNPSLKFEFSSGFGSYVTEAFVAGVDHHMMVLPTGDYRLSSIYANTVQFLPQNASRFHGWDFHVEAGKINYFGEMVFDGNTNRKHYKLEAIKRLVKEKYPTLAERYSVVEAAL